MRLKKYEYNYLDEKENFHFRKTKWIEHIKSGIKIDSFRDTLEINFDLEKRKSRIEIGYTIEPRNGIVFLKKYNEEEYEVWCDHNYNDLEIKISDNIKSFEKELKSIFRDNFKTNQLKNWYRNENEDFWRINSD